MFGKWSPNCEGPFIVSTVLRGGAYKSINIQGEDLSSNINGKYLKMYYPTIWEGIPNVDQN